MHEAGARTGIIGLGGEIFSVSSGGFGILSHIEAFGEAEKRGRIVFLNVEGIAKFCCGLRGALQAEIDAAEMHEWFGVARIEPGGAVKGIGGSRQIAGSLSPGDAESYLAGLIIGADIRSALAGGQAPVTIVGSPTLTALYAASLVAFGVQPREQDGRTAVVNGLIRLRDRLKV